MDVGSRLPGGRLLNNARTRGAALSEHLVTTHGSDDQNALTITSQHIGNLLS